MKKVLFVFFVLLSTGSFSQTNTTVVGQPVFSAASEYDFGVVMQGDDMTRKVEVTNTGSAPLIISNCKPSCSCSVTKCSNDPIMPGEKSFIEFKYDSKRLGPVNKSMTVTSNDPDNPVIVIRFKGNVIERPVNKR